MLLQRRSHGWLDFSARHRRALEPLDQNRRGVDETRRAVAALEAELIEERLLHGRDCKHVPLFVRLGNALNRADALAVEEACAGDAGAHLLAAAVVAIPD